MKALEAEGKSEKAITHHTPVKVSAIESIEEPASCRLNHRRASSTLGREAS